jgi:subtilisin family serine protease
MVGKSRIRICLLVAIAIATGLGVGRALNSGRSTAQAGAAIAVQAQPGILCGVNATVDSLLGCAPPAAPAQATTTAATTTAASSPTQALEQLPPVVRSSTHATYLPNVLLVRFRPGVSPARESALLARLGASSATQIAHIGVRSVVVDPARLTHVLTALRGSRLVRYADRDEVLHVMGATVNDTFFANQWGLRLAGFTKAWGRTHGSGNVIVAVVDTGVTSVPDLAGLVLPGVDLVNGDTDASDDNGHGTNVAGVIAAHAGNGLGGAGVCWKCSILPIKVMGANGNGDLATVAAGIVKAADMGAKVIDVSLGGPVGVPALQQAVTYASSKGALVVAAAGNSGLAVPFYPANYANVISVAGSNQTDRLYSWSEHGPWIKVAAPGCNVAPTISGGYGEFCGTSSATPLVAGLAAYLISARPQTTSVKLIRAVQRATRHIKTGVAFGRIDASASLTAVKR